MENIVISKFATYTLVLLSPVVAHGAEKADTTIFKTDSIKEVVVTAQESRGLTSSSKIARHAMEHLQPSSFADLLELLPGGMAKDPSLSTPNTIRIREATPITNSNYATSSLGTKFVIDGAPISTNANMQYLAGALDNTSNSRDFTNKGVDMRTISTDDIESVEIVRGIPSVEYGDLTSGLVKIRRRRGGTGLSARFKADMDTKLFYVAKDFEWGNGMTTLNLSADYLDNKADPRNLLETYTRFSLSARLGKTWLTDNDKFVMGLNFDYGGSFDGDRVDPDINYGGVDKYKQSYNRFALSTQIDYTNRRQGAWLHAASAVASLSYEKDKTERTRLVQLDRETPAATSTTDGEYYATIIYPYKYTATQFVDGQPLSAYLKLNADMRLPFGGVYNNMRMGADWLMDKNYGDGQVFDALHPLSPGTAARMRKYSAVPAEHNLSAYAEERLSFNLGRHRIDVQAGLRTSTLLNLERQYQMHGRVYADPRINIGWTLPTFTIAHRPLTVQIGGGYGEHTKMPTMDYLYPANIYMDLVEMNYWHEKRDYRAIYLKTYVVDPTNYDLKAARNKKWELRTDLSYHGNRLSVTYFEEDMRSGFRMQTIYAPYTYNKYNTSAIDANALAACPDVSQLSYETISTLMGITKTTNGSRTKKQGVEYTLQTRRFPKINTRLTITGAWFKTTYRNSQALMVRPSKYIGSSEYKYVGIYQDEEGYIREQLNTNFTFDTDVPKLKLGFSISAQCMWQTAAQRMSLDNNPSQYMDEYGTIHDFTDADAADGYLQYMVRTYSDALYQRQTVPFAMNLNLKATKKLLNDKLMVALFVNKLLDAHPDYVRNNYTIRRYVTPYFGLEMNVRL